MAARSPQSQALHDGFNRHVLPMLEPLGFVAIGVPREQHAVGWTCLAAECRLPSGARLRAELDSSALGPPRFHILRFEADGSPAGSIDLICTESDPATPRRTTVSHALSAFEALAEAAQGGEPLAARRRLALEFLGAELAATSDQLVAAVPEIAPRVDAARQTAPWRDAALRARTLFERRNVRSELEDRPVEGKFTFFGAALVVIEAEGERFTFRFDTSMIDRARVPVVSGWWTTAAGTRQASRLTVGGVQLRFDPSGTLVAEG